MCKQFSALLLTVALLSCLALPLFSRAECRKAEDNEKPHGANELIELKEQKVQGLFGTILFPNEPAEDIVVEVYRWPKRPYTETVQQQRLAACVTGADGKFSFPEIKPGRYLVQAGVRERFGVNITYLVVDLKANSGKHKGRGIRIPLHPGT
jgi:hypothetical protein